MKLCIASACLASFALASTIRAQWEAIDWAPDAPVVLERDLALHENDIGHWAFSAFSRRWHLVSLAGAELQGSGERIAVFREGPVLRAWSPRFPQQASLLVANLKGLWIGETLCGALDAGDLPQKAAAVGFSSELGLWSVRQLKSPFVQHDLGASVFAVVEAGTAHAFSAQSGAWTSFADNSFKFLAPKARGNAVFVELQRPFSGPLAERRLLAYSGARGVWSLSPPLALDGPQLLGGAQALACELAGDSAWRVLGYSAHSGLWVASTRTHAVGAVEFSGGNGVALVRDLADGSFEALGLLPGEEFAPAPPGSSLVALGDELLLLEEAAAGRAWGFSALAGGAFAPRDLGGPVEASALARHFGLLRAGGAWHAFSSATASFAPAQAAGASSSVGLADSVADLVADERLWGYSARWNRWNAGPLLAAGLPQSAGSGSLRMHLVPQARGASRLAWHDERADQWIEAAQAPGASLPQVAANLALRVEPQELEGWSAARGTWSLPESFALPVQGALELADNVAVARDGAGKLWAYSARADVMLGSDWPNGAGLQAAGPLPTPSAGSSGAASPAADPQLRVTLQGEPITDFCVWMWSSALARTPLEIPGWSGLLTLDLALGGVGEFFLPIQPGGLLHTSFPLPLELPAGVTLWFQAFVLDVESLEARFGDRAQPLLVF